MKILSHSLTFLFVVSSFFLFGQEEIFFPFERTYPANDENHLTLDLDSLPSGGFLGLAIEKNEDDEFRKMNVTEFDKKGNINWTRTFEYKRNYDLLPIGDIILTGDSIAFSAVLDTVAYQKVITKIGRDGGYGWSKVYHSEDQVEAVFQGRSELSSFYEESVIQITNIIRGGSTDLLVSIVDTLGEIIVTKSINASPQSGEEDMIIDAQSTLDSGIIMLSNTTSNFVVTKMNRFGDISWMKSYESPLDNTVKSQAQNFTELANGDIAVAGHIELTDGSAENLILRLSGEGEIVTGHGLSATDESINIREIGGLPDSTIIYSGFKFIGINEGEPYMAQLKLDSTLGWNSFSYRSIDREIMGLTALGDGGAAMYISGGTSDITERETPYLVRYDENGMRNTACFAQSLPIELTFIDMITNDVDFQEELLTGLSDTISVKDEDYEGFTPPILNLQDTTYCPQDPINYTLDATVQGGIGYLWSNNVSRPAAIVTVTEEGEYSVTITVRDQARIACFILCDTANVTKRELPEVQIIPNFLQFCETGEAILNASANNPIVEIEWSTGVVQDTRIAISDPGTYRVTIVDDCGNEAQGSLSLGQPDFDIELPLNVTLADTYCTNGSIRIDLVGFNGNPAALTWSNGEAGVTSISVTEPGTYSVSFEGFCPGFAEIAVSDNLFLDPGTIGINMDCGTNAVTLVASEEGIVSRVWSTGESSSSISVTEAGNYTVTGTDLCGDQVTAGIDVTIDNLRNCGIEDGVISINKTCGTNVVILTADEANIVSRQWSTGSNAISIDISEVGVYSVTGTDQFGAQVTAEVDVTIEDFRDCGFLGEISINKSCVTNVVILTAEEVNILNREWSTGSNATSIDISEVGVYSVTGTDQFGEQVTAEVEVTKEDLTTCNVVSDQPCMEFPNAFVPNSRDEINRIFAPKSDCGELLSYELKIYNRWGGQVFKSERVEEGWNGRKGDKEAPADVYFFYSVYDAGGVEFEEKGDILLIR